jgi:outer membrane protein assembly factor BamB
VIGSPVRDTPILGNPAWTPAVSGNRVFLRSYTETRGIKTYRLEAFDNADGHRHWRVPIGQSRYLTFGPRPSRVSVSSSRARAATSSRTDSAPAIANGVVYVGSGDGNVYAFDLKTGERLWSARLGAKAVTSSPTVVNGAVYVGSNDGNVFAFRLRR